MTDILNKFSYYFQFEMVRYAMIVGILIALCSSLLGVTLVLKRFSFIGDGLAHVAFGAMAISVALTQILKIPADALIFGAGTADLTNFFMVLPITVICAVLLLRMGQNAKIKGDAAIAMISVGSLGMGYLIMNKFAKSSNLAADVCSTLFGSTSILTLTKTQVWLCAVFSVLVVAAFLLLYHKIFAVTFDEDFASATGTNAKTYNLIIAVIIAVIVVLAMNLVGSLLISALVIFPALSAMRVFKSFKSVTVCSVIVSVVCAVLGILISVAEGTPVGSTIVAVDITGFVMFSAAGFIIGKI